MIYVTHDQVEAMTLADKVVVLNGGRIEQVGSPMELYHHPANLFVAGFRHAEDGLSTAAQAVSKPAAAKSSSTPVVACSCR